MRSWATWLGAGVLTLFVLVETGHPGEQKVNLDKVPKPVLKSVTARFKDAKVTGASTEKDGDKIVYEISVSQGGKNIDVTVTPQGAIILIEKEIDAKDLPKPVAKALASKYPKAIYKIVEEVTKVEGKQETFQYYEVALVTADKKALEVQLAADGKILKEEKSDGK